MTKIGQKKTSGNGLQKRKNLESSESVMKIATYIFGYEICSILNIFGFKIFNESILLGFN